MPLVGNPVQFDKFPDEGVPSAGVVSVGDVNVLFVKVSLPDNVASVPVISGKVILRFAVWTNSNVVPKEFVALFKSTDIVRADPVAPRK